MRSQSGFSLIELSVAMIMIGLLTIPVFEKAKRDMTEDRLGVTSYNLNIVVSKAIDDFYFLNRRFPCPANPTLNESNPNFGVEIANCSATAPDASIVVTGVPTIVRGMIPFKSLNIPKENVLDGFDNRLTYVLSKSHAIPGHAADVSTYPGAITIRGYQQNDDGDRLLDGGGNPVITSFAPPAASPGSSPASYVIISHGENGIGAYNDRGIIVAQCADATRESENCDNDAEFFSHTNARSTSANQNTYDDRIIYQIGETSRVFHVDEGKNVLMGQASSYYGINQPDPQVEVDVGGTVLAEGNVHAVSYCLSDRVGYDDDDGCFSPSMIGGEGIACPSGSVTSNNGVMIGIGNSNAKCRSLSGVNPGTCGASEYITGVDATGAIICSPI